MRGLVLLAFLLGATAAHAQTPVIALPPPTNPTILTNGTVTAGGTFQQVLASNPARTGCLIQNTSSHTAYVYWLATGTASTTNSLQIPAGVSFYCANRAGGVIKTAIQWTTGTTGDTFVYSENQ